MTEEVKQRKLSYSCLRFAFWGAMFALGTSSCTGGLNNGGGEVIKDDAGVVQESDAAVVVDNACR